MVSYTMQHIITGKNQGRQGGAFSIPLGSERQSALKRGYCARARGQAENSKQTVRAREVWRQLKASFILFHSVPFGKILPFQGRLWSEAL